MRGIYKIENRINGKVYIGESLDIHKRWELHISELNDKTHHSYKLQEDWNTYSEFSLTTIFSLIILLFIVGLLIISSFSICSIE